jgi:hypothetical protein
MALTFLDLPPVRYRGYLIIERWYSATGTERIRRADGSWRDSEPTEVGAGWTAWIVARRLVSREIEEEQTTRTQEEAIGDVDSWGGAGEIPCSSDDRRQGSFARTSSRNPQILVAIGRMSPYSVIDELLDELCAHTPRIAMILTGLLLLDLLLLPLEGGEWGWS